MCSKLTELQVDEPCEIRKIPTPQVKLPTDILIKIAVASFCHTDMLAIEGRMNGPPPITLSHEPTGTIVALGDDAKKTFAVGDRVASLLWYNPCGSCKACNGPPDMQHRCQKMGGFIGCTINGALQEFLIVDSREAVKIPDGMSFIEAAPLTCAGATVWRALKVSKAAPDSWLAIVGSGGGLGHLLVAFAKAKGIKVVGLEAREQGVELTKRAGADHAINVRDEDFIQQVHSISGGEGVPATIVLADAPSAATSGFKVTMNEGLVVQIAQVGRYTQLTERETIADSPSLRLSTSRFGKSLYGIFR